MRHRPWLAALAASFLASRALASPGTCLPDSVLGPASALVATGQTPHAIAVADINGDGFPDLVVANTGMLSFGTVNTGLSILDNDGHGHFPVAQPRLDAGAGPVAVVVLDLNHDGILDIAVADQYSGAVEVLLGTGGGNFAPPVSYLVSNKLTDLAAGDLNHDGIPDLVATAFNQFRVSVLIGAGDGTFTAASGISTAAAFAHPECVALADFNRDGNLDLAVSLGINGINVYPGNGDGTFGTPQTISYGNGNWHPANLAVGDLNGDGFADLVVAGPAYGAWYALGNGDGTFQGIQPTNSPVLGSVALADVDGDGRMDIVASVPGGNGVGWMRRMLDGEMVMFQQPMATPAGPTGIAVADLDGDGRPDVAVAAQSADGVTVILNPCRPAPPFVPTPPPPGPHDPYPSWIAWQPNGVPVCAAPLAQQAPLAVPDGTGGAFFTWRDGRDGLVQSQLAVMRIGGNGLPAPGWPVNGFEFTAPPAAPQSASIASDDAGGVFIAWEDARSAPSQIYLQHLLGSGTIAPGWPANGLQVATPGYVTWPMLARDGYGGLYIGWRDRRANPFSPYVLRVDASGAPVAGWPVTGIQVDSNVTDWGSVVDDGAGGAYLAWGAHLPVYAGALSVNEVAHVEPDGTIDERHLDSHDESEIAPKLAADPPGGAVAAQGLGQALQPVHLGWNRWEHPELSPLNGYNTPVAVAPDRTGGLFAIAEDATRTQLLGWHYDWRNTAVASWTFGPGVVLSNPAVAAVPDSAGGVFAVWQDFRHSRTSLFGARVTSAGTAAPGWSLGGTPIADVAIVGLNGMIGDGYGGAIVFWQDLRHDDGDIYAQRIETGDLPTSTLAGLVSADATAERVHLVWTTVREGVEALVQRHGADGVWTTLALVRSDSQGLLTYDDRTASAGTRYAYRLASPADGAGLTPESWVSTPAALAFALAGLQPNPGGPEARIVFTVRDPSPVTMEIFDVSGRRVLERHFDAPEPGTHAVALGDATVGPGVYLLRLTQGSRTLHARACVLE
jgi:hypothetical protein